MKTKKTRIQWTVVLLGGWMYDLLYVFGSEMEKYGTCRMPDTFFKALVLFPLFSAALWVLLEMGSRSKGRTEKQNGRFCLLGNMMAILLCWLPMYLIMSPGVFCVDTANQLGQIVTGQYSTHHPLLHTFLLKFCIDLRPFMGSLNRCAMLYSAGQAFLLAGCFALTSASIARSCSPKAAAWSTAFFALHPLHMIYAVSATKDVLFSGVFVLFLALCVEIVKNTTPPQLVG